MARRKGRSIGLKPCDPGYLPLDFFMLTFALSDLSLVASANPFFTIATPFDIEVLSVMFALGHSLMIARGKSLLGVAWVTLIAVTAGCGGGGSSSSVLP